MVRQKPTRGWLRKVAAAIAWVLFGAVILVASAALHVLTPLAREVVRDVVIERVNRGIRGRVEVGHVAEMDWGRLRVEHLAVFDPEGARVLHVPEATVEVDMASLLSGAVEIESVRARDGRLRLIETPEGPPTIAQAFEPTAPKPEEEPGPDVTVDAVRLEGFRVRASYDPLRDLVARDVDVEGRLSVEDGVLDLTIGAARGEVVRDGRVVAALESLEGRFAGGPGGRAAGEARLAVGDGTVDLAVVAELPEEPEARPYFEARAEIAAVAPKDLSTLGIDTAKLAGDVSGTVRFDGTPDTFAATADLDTAGGPIRAQVVLDEREEARVRVTSDGLDPSAVWEGLEVPPVSGEIDAHVSGLSEPTRLDVSARGRDVRVGEYHVPSVVITGVTAPDHVRIESLSLPYLKGDVDVKGTVGFDGEADLHVEARVPDISLEPNLVRTLDEASGALEASLDVEASPSKGDAPPRIRVEGEVSVRDGELGPVKGRELRFEGEVSGRADRPVVDGRLTGRDVTVGDSRVGRLDVRVAGGPDRYQVRGDVVGPEGERGRIEADVGRMEEGFAIDARGTARGSEVTVEGVYRPDGESEIETQIERLDAELLARMLGLEGLAGRARGEAQLRGSLARPEIEAVLWLREGTVRGVYVDDAALVLALSSEAGTLEAELEVDLGTRGAVSAKVEGQFRQGPKEPLGEALRGGRYDVTAEAREVELALVSDARPDAPPLHGKLDAEVEARGTIASPEATVQARITDFGYRTPSELDLEVMATYRDRHLQVGAVAKDDRGRIAVADLGSELPLSRILREPSRLARAVTTQSWSLSIRTDARRLDALPEVIRIGVPARVALAAHVEHRPGRPLAAEADLGLTWLGDLESCAIFDEPRARMRLRLEDGQATVDVVGRLGVEQVLAVNVRTPLDIDRWVRRGVPERLPPLDATVELADLELSRTPWVCRVASGRVNGRAELTDLLTEAPAVLANLRGRAIRYGDAPPTDLGVRLRADRDAAHVALEMVDRAGEGLEATLDVPVDWRGALPTLAGAGPLRAQVVMDGFRLEPLGVLPAVSFAEGKLDGAVDVTGSLDAPVFDGFIELDDVAFGLEQPAQRYEDGSGRIVFHRDWVEIDRLHFHDLDGTLRVSGGIAFDGLVPRRARLAVFTDDLPIRNEGMPIGYVTSNVAVRAQLREPAELLEVWVDVEDLTLAVPERLRDLQPLEPHPDIVIVRDGEPVEKPAPEEPTRLLPMEVVFHIDAREPFWVRRQDFAVQLTSRLEVRLVGPEVRVAGWTTIRRGNLDLLGKRFVVEEGRVDFAGGTELNPFVNVLLSHEPAGRPGQKVFVRVTGDLQEPQLELSSTIPDVDTPAEVLGLVAGTGRGVAPTESEEAAAEQAASFLAGVTAGILTLTARRELGDLFPDIAIETVGRGARFRAGFDAGALVPEFLRGIVRGASVQGYVGTGVDDQPTGAEAVGGVLLELIFPYSIVGSAEIQPPASWAVEVRWEP